MTMLNFDFTLPNATASGLSLLTLVCFTIRFFHTNDSHHHYNLPSNTRKPRTAKISSLPGPPPLSPLTGNLTQLFDPKGLSFHLMLSEVYGGGGGVVRVWGFFSFFRYFRWFGKLIGLTGGWGEEVYVSDPRAIAEVLRREGECFDETGVFLECVFPFSVLLPPSSLFHPPILD